MLGIRPYTITGKRESDPMYIKSKALGVVWKFALVACAFVGVGLQIGIFSGNLHLSGLRYFTNLSNLFCMVYFLVDALYLLFHRENDGSRSWCFPLKGIAMMGITVTWLVAHFMLGNFTMGASMQISIRLVHYVVPVMTILDWLLFDEKGQMRATSPLLWTTLPLLYFAVVMLLAALTAGTPFYPYPFMNVSTQGLTRVLVTVVLMVAFFVALGYVFFLVDRLLSRAKRHTGRIVTG